MGAPPILGGGRPPCAILHVADAVVTQVTGAVAPTLIVVANGAVLLLIALLLLFSPLEIDFPVTSTQASIIISGFVLSLILNALLLRPAIAPLRHLADAVRSVDPSEPGRPLFIPHADAEVTALTKAYNDMLDRLEDERRESGRRVLAAQEQVRCGGLHHRRDRGARPRGADALRDAWLGGALGLTRSRSAPR
jgi:HAMP domain-containing protein